MNYLFYFVHPSKYYVFRETINHLILSNHTVDIIISSKDILDKLVARESWKYINLFPNGRKIKGLHPLISTSYYFFKTILKLNKITKWKKYDLLITDDLLVFLSKKLKSASIVFTDDDIHVTRIFSIILTKATHILAPEITNLGRYNKKKIGFNSYKELAYLHPKIFYPDINIVKKFNPNLDRYFIIRLVAFNAYHDTFKKGLNNSRVKEIILLLEKFGKVFITAERKLPPEFQKYNIGINPWDIAHALYYAELFIGDSQTMTSEAAILGTLSFRCNDFVGKISVMDEKESKYELSFNYLTHEVDKMLIKIQDVLQKGYAKKDMALKREKMLSEKINLSKFMIWLFENYPQSIEEYKINPQIQYKFK